MLVQESSYPTTDRITRSHVAATEGLPGRLYSGQVAPVFLVAPVPGQCDDASGMRLPREQFRTGNNHEEAKEGRAHPSQPAPGWSRAGPGWCSPTRLDLSSRVPASKTGRVRIPGTQTGHQCHRHGHSSGWLADAPEEVVLRGHPLPRRPCSVGYSPHTTRKPYRSACSGTSQGRCAERQCQGRLYQEPPRKTCQSPLFGPGGSISGLSK
jgi:hypothetical protein